MDTTDVWVLGGHQTDFARHLTREGLGFRDLTREVVERTLEAAGVPAEAVEVVHVGNAFGETFTGQGHLGAMPATVVDGLWGTPASRHEGACASGSLAVLAAVADLRSGAYDCALVLGVELEKTVPSAEGARLLGGAALLPDELDGVTFPWPEQFSRVADEYDARYGLDDAHLRRIAQVNLEAARRNPRAQTRGWTVPDDLADEAANPVVAGRLRRFDCSQVTDGGAGVVLVTDAWRRAHPHVRPLARIEGWGHRVVGLPLEPKLARSRAGSAGGADGSPYVMPHVRRAVTDALGRAGTDLEGLAGYEVHDCFAPSEYLAIDHLGLTGPGESWKAVENGDIELGGSFPVNPSGGLIGGGHPVGATGVRMLLDATRQVSGTAGDYQVEGARRFGTLNIGGSTATTVSLVVGAPPA